MDYKILLYVQPSHMTLMQYAKGLYAKSCKFGYDYDKSTFCDSLLEGVDSFICHSLPEYLAIHPHADVINIKFKTQLLFVILEKITKLAKTNNQAASSKQYGKHIWNMLLAHAIEIASLTSPSRSSRHRLRSPPLFAIHKPAESKPRSDTPSLPSTLPSLVEPACEVCYNSSHSMLSCHALPRDVLLVLAAIRECNMKTNGSWDQNQHTSFSASLFAKNRRFHKNWQQSSSPVQNTRVMQLEKNAHLQQITRIWEIKSRNRRQTNFWPALPSFYKHRAPYGQQTYINLNSDNRPRRP